MKSHKKHFANLAVLIFIQIFLTPAAFAQRAPSDEEIKVQVANTEIDTVYTKVMSNLNAEQKEALRNSQRSWLAWRDAEAKFIASFNEVGGASQRSDYFTAQEQIIKQRTEVLRRYLGNNQSSSEQASGNQKPKSDDIGAPQKDSREITVSTKDSLEYMGSWLLKQGGGDATQIAKFINKSKFSIKAFRGSM